MCAPTFVPSPARQLSRADPRRRVPPSQPARWKVTLSGSSFLVPLIIEDSILSDPPVVGRRGGKCFHLQHRQAREAFAAGFRQFQLGYFSCAAGLSMGTVAGGSSGGPITSDSTRRQTQLVDGHYQFRTSP
ncbi:Hypothetical protein NTJ_05412 [Nesidiocoris tenuis]|uniref:Amidase domain-containing protein n=1 Tax=Nesidiocoris tenuis TaxID=355587 RepID=A0ABN7AQC9_9HEMI|nr:Hypothetical protein NTJ_05412 [Nesidiocoris tenuis]